MDQSSSFPEAARASAPPTISVSSWVICACRAWLACRDRFLMMSFALSVAALQAARRAADSLAAASSYAA
jgi:hypothetical protein